MRTLLTLVLSCCCLLAFADNKTFSKLTDVNRCWTEQKDLPQLPHYRAMSERQWIQTHLSLVEQALRARDVSQLSAEQKQKRNQSLNDLHQYWQSGQFPINDQYAFRTPIFIDKYDNFCAVGYLVKASGHEAVSRKIAANTNLAYVRQMHYPELTAWAKEYGFTTDELAWIQPGYPPEMNARPVGGGVDGEVFELFADETEGKLYVGGTYTMADGSVQANNISYVTEQNGVYTWHNMNNGVNGEVHAIQKFDGKIFIAGHFSMTVAGSTALNNVAYWDGSAWQPAGCTYGTIKDLVVYRDELYAVGDFDVCAASSEVNFARWTGTMWQHIPFLEGHVNTVEVWNDKLLLGGSFQYYLLSANAILWDPVNNFQAFTNIIQNEVMDFQAYKGTMYAACKFSGGTDSVLLKKLSGTMWVDEPLGMNIEPGTSFNTLCADVDTFMLGGKFTHPMMMTPVSNCFGLLGTGDWFVVDDAINKMVTFKGRLYAGGKFKKDIDNQTYDLNSIGYKQRKYPQNVNEVRNGNSMIIYPNPAGNTIQLKGLDKPTAFAIYNIQGQKLMNGDTEGKIDISSLPSGNYLIRMTNNPDFGMQFVKE